MAIAHIEAERPTFVAADNPLNWVQAGDDNA